MEKEDWEESHQVGGRGGGLSVLDFIWKVLLLHRPKQYNKSVISPSFL